jgi:hypothetical protein
LRFPWVNVTLLVILIGLLITGLWGLVTSDAAFSWVMALHGVGGYAVAAVLAWKAAVILDAFRRRRRSLSSGTSLAFVGMAMLLLAVLLTGFAWAQGVGPRQLAGFSAINVHAFLAIGLSLLLLWHLLARRFVLRIPQATDRRAFLRTGTAGLAGLGLWLLARPVQALFDLPGAHRRFTGSYETGSFGGEFPPTSWLFDNPKPIDIISWRLEVNGSVDHPLSLSYGDLAAFGPGETSAILDCTGGWYTTQVWRGIWLHELLAAARPTATARSVTLVSVTGYRRRFPLASARELLLATHVAGQPLSHGHGAPARLVAPNHRGFDWVKWIVRVEVNDSSAAWQSPLPLQ